MSQRVGILSVSTKTGVANDRSPLAAIAEATVEDILLLKIT